jgi:hypothetical protein
VLKQLNKDTLPALGGMAIYAITAQGCLAVLRSIEQRGSHETATRSLGVISPVPDDSVAIGDGTLNPAHSLKRHAPIKQTTAHLSHPGERDANAPQNLVAASVVDSHRTKNSETGKEPNG